MNNHYGSEFFSHYSSNVLITSLELRQGEFELVLLIRIPILVGYLMGRTVILDKIKYLDVYTLTAQSNEKWPICLEMPNVW